MRLIPTMTVVMSADAYETEQAVRVAARTDGPFYISLARGQLPIDMAEADRCFEPGKASVLREGTEVTIIGTGPTVAEALKAGQMLEGADVSARVLSMHTVKPIDRDAVLQAADTQLIVTIEEHTVIGGLGGAVAEVLAEAGAGTPLKRLGLQDAFACMVGSYDDVKQRFGITAGAVVDEVLSALS